MVTLTERAAARVREIMARAEKPYAGLRVGVKNGGCAGQEYVSNTPRPPTRSTRSSRTRASRILVEPKAVLFLLGSEIDFEATKLAAKFVFHNPNETDACGCGESVTIEPAAARDP